VLGALSQPATVLATDGELGSRVWRNPYGGDRRAASPSTGNREQLGGDAPIAVALAGDPATDPHRPGLHRGCCDSVPADMELRALTVLDSLQPQLTGFLQTVCSGFMPLEEEAALFIEIAPGIAINRLTDAALKATTCRPGMQIVERAYGMLELHSDDKGQVFAAVDAILSNMGVAQDDRYKPRVVSSQIITGLDGHQSQLINRMRHGDMIMSGQTLYILEVFPAAYAALAANEAEKAANVHLMEVVTFGAFGRLWLGGSEAEIKAAVEAAEGALAKVSGRPSK